VQYGTRVGGLRASYGGPSAGRGWVLGSPPGDTDARDGTLPGAEIARAPRSRVSRAMARAARAPRPCVYILRCRDGTLYTGAASDLARRLVQHAAGRASRYTRARLPVALVWSRRVRSWGDALRVEHQIKALRRAEKDALVQNGGRLPRRRAR